LFLDLLAASPPDDKLFFLRIDNQFYDQDLQVHNFKTHREADFSDHFPISATYSLDPE
jgi:endonuclease/exonuclease/phosphatase family metal-dependent hydrolase